jgi:hypothetical protein
LLLAPDGEEAENLLVAVLFGLFLGLVFGLTAASERLRQRRLKRLGIWDGSWAEPGVASAGNARGRRRGGNLRKCEQIL